MSEPKGWNDLRPEVQQFALLMEEKLRLHDETKGKTAWKQDEASSLLSRVEEEASEMSEAIEDLEAAWAWNDDEDPEEPDMELLISNFVWEAVDVANMAMMAADVLGFLKPSAPIVHSFVERCSEPGCTLNNHSGMHCAPDKVWSSKDPGLDDTGNPYPKDYWLFRKGNEDVEGSRWIGGDRCRPINPQPLMVACWSRGEMCPDRVQDSDDPKDEIKAIRRTLAYLVKRQWDQDARDISMKNESDC